LLAAATADSSGSRANSASAGNGADEHPRIQPEMRQGAIISLPEVETGSVAPNSLDLFSPAADLASPLPCRRGSAAVQPRPHRTRIGARELLVDGPGSGSGKRLGVHRHPSLSNGLQNWRA
jgi:hypothetical protein